MSYIQQQHLFPDRGKVLLAVSGGRDSVTLCHLMHQAGYTFDIAHCNFHLRPGDCNRDEAFVRQLASQYDCRIFVAQFRTRENALSHGVSIEEQARNERYGFFAQLLHREHYSCVAVAHHLDDSIETFFLNLLRGTGISGLHGIKPLRSRSITMKSHDEDYAMVIARPLLCFTRQEIDTYVQQHLLEYVEDYTNSQKEYRRNKIRLELMPLLEKMSPNFHSTMADNMLRLGEAEELYLQRVEEVRRHVVIDDAASQIPHSNAAEVVMFSLPLVQAMRPLRTLLYELLLPYNFTMGIVDNVMAALNHGSGRHFASSTHRLTIERDRMMVEPLSAIPNAAAVLAVPEMSTTLPCHNIPLPEGDTLCLSLTALSSFSSPPPTQESPSAPPCLHLSRHQACFDLASLRQPLQLRRWHSGDRFRPFGMKGSKLVSDYFNDHKFSRYQREHCWLLADAQGDILWLVGHRASAIAPAISPLSDVLLLTLSHPASFQSS